MIAGALRNVLLFLYCFSRYQHRQVPGKPDILFQKSSLEKQKCQLTARDQHGIEQSLQLQPVGWLPVMPLHVAIHLCLWLATGGMEFTGGLTQDGVVGFLIKRAFSFFLLIFFQVIRLCDLKKNHYNSLLLKRRLSSVLFLFCLANFGYFLRIVTKSMC